MQWKPPKLRCFEWSTKQEKGKKSDASAAGGRGQWDLTEVWLLKETKALIARNIFYIYWRTFTQHQAVWDWVSTHDA